MSLSLNTRFTVRAVTVLLAVWVVTWMLTDVSGWKSLLVAVVATAVVKAIEFVGPGSDVGIRWTRG